MINQKKTHFGAAVGIASTWFGLHCGGGFATGAQGVLYFTQYGAWELVTTFIAAALMGIYAYLLWDYCRLAQTYTYRSAYDSIFHPYGKIFGSIHEILYLMILVMAMGAVFSGAANVTITIFPQIPYALGVLIVATLVFFMTIYGDRILLRFSTSLSILLISSIVMMSIAGMASNPDAIREVIVNWETGDATFFDALVSAIVYVGFQTTVMVGTVSVAQSLKTPSDTKWAGFFGFLLNFVIMIFVCTMMLGFYPAVVGQQLPIITILEGIGNPYLTGIYYLALYLACITTGITLVFSLVRRLNPVLRPVISNDRTRDRVLSIGIIVVCYLISLFGLLAIIGKGYGMVGYLSIPLVYLPSLIIVPLKRRRMLTAQK